MKMVRDSKKKRERIKDERERHGGETDVSGVSLLLLIASSCCLISKKHSTCPVFTAH